MADPPLSFSHSWLPGLLPKTYLSADTPCIASCFLALELLHLPAQQRTRLSVTMPVSYV